MVEIKLLKELGTVMETKERLQQEIADLNKREQELLKLLGVTKPTEPTKRDIIAGIRDAIKDVMKDLRNQRYIWVPPRMVINLVGEKLPEISDDEIIYRLRELANLKDSDIKHNGQRGRGSAYFYIGLEQ